LTYINLNEKKQRENFLIPNIYANTKKKKKERFKIMNKTDLKHKTNISLLKAMNTFDT
jgi:hypothetical protein